MSGHWGVMGRQNKHVVRVAADKGTCNTTCFHVSRSCHTTQMNTSKSFAHMSVLRPDSHLIKVTEWEDSNTVHVQLHTKKTRTCSARP